MIASFSRISTRLPGWIDIAQTMWVKDVRVTVFIISGGAVADGGAIGEKIYRVQNLLRSVRGIGSRFYL